jgi:gliding motility-associated-like protein
MLLNTKTRKEAAITTFDFGGRLQFQGDSLRYCLEEPGTYTMKIYSKGKNGCSGTYTYPFPIVVNPKPNTDFILNPEIPTTAEQLTFTPVVNNGPVTRYSWQFSGGVDALDTSRIRIKAAGTDTSALESPIRFYDKPGKYPVMLTTTTDKGCSDTAVKFVSVIDELQIFIPNTFTPNGDGINDMWNVKGIGMKLENYTMEVTDRWGNVVFFTRDINQGWDGTNHGALLRDGTYNYTMRVVGANGEGRREYNGQVNIIK